jgi:DNA-binding transcriptional ArsR family regulator
MINYKRLAVSETHPLRLKILKAYDASKEPLSPNQLYCQFKLKVGLSTVSYHVAALRDAGLIGLVKEVPRRGAVEHYYRVVS